MYHFKKKLLISLFVTTFLTGCFAHRDPLPIGHIPTQGEVLAEDEKYGHQVLSQLTQQYPLDRDDDRIARARMIVAKLTTVNSNDKNIWHVYVLNDPKLKNAAATKGNYIFIWSALLDSISDDDKIATVLAHEIAHVLARHVEPDSTMRVNEMITGVAGNTARRILYRQGGTYGALAALGDLLIRETLEATLVNPQKQRLELEADQIGLFLMAEAGYDPRAAITFWEEALNDPQLSGPSIEFLSSHPLSETRLLALKDILPQVTGESINRKNTEKRGK